MINSIKKGKRVEREVAKILSRLTNCTFERVPMSGGFATSRNTKSCVFNGDLFCEEEPYKESLVVEVKATKEKILISDILNEKSTLNKWIAQSKRECGTADWLLIFKMNGKKTIFLCTYHVLLKYKKIFENSKPTQCSDYWIGELK